MADMADEFTAGMCAENWWMHPSQINFGSSVCSSIKNNMDMLLWPCDLDMKRRTAGDETAPSANSDEGSIIFHDSYKTSNQDSYAADGSLLSMNNTLENIVDNDLSSSITQDWNHTILGDSKTSECNHDQGNFLGSINSSSDYRQHPSADNLSEINKDWSAMKFSTINNQDSFIDYYNKGPTNQGSSSYGNASSLIKNLFDSESHQDSIFGNQYSMEYPTLSDFCQEKFNEFPSSSLLKPSLPVLPNQPLTDQLNLPNNSSCNASNDDGLFTSVQSQFLSPKFEYKLSCANLSAKSNSERSREMMSTEVKNSITEPALKRQRIETPSISLPTFKVRKEKLGDRVTGLQQLVSPFGKTDTASVLHEAIEYIKLLHDQVTVLIAPYYKGGSPINQHDQSVIDVKGSNQSLKNWGLCIVPISSTFQLTTADFWMPTFGGSFK